MGLRGFSPSVGDRGVQTDLVFASTAKAGVAMELQSTSSVKLASNSLTHVLEWDVTADGITASDILLGVEVKETQQGKAARLRPLYPGDVIQVDADALASASDVGAIDGTVAVDASLGVDPATGKWRQKQTTDVLLARVAPDGSANNFNTDGTIWIQIVALDSA